jgi:hypothetical protein
VLEKSLSSRLTFSSTSGFDFPLDCPTENRPPVIFTSLTDRSRLLPADEAGAFDFAPRLEKFQSPEAVCSSVISGWSMVSAVTFSLCEKISGINSTATCSDLARTNGLWLKAGWSAIERSSAVMPPCSSAT